MRLGKMEINLDYSEKEIKWNYNTKNYIYKVDDIEFVTESCQYIYIEINKDTGYEYRYIDLKGNDICWYNENNDISIFDRGSKIRKDIHMSEIRDVMIIKDMIYVMKGKSEVLQFDAKGDINTVIIAPQGYRYYRFTGSDKLEVVCEGNEQTVDKFGRNDWRFEYNFQVDKWDKKSLAM